MLNVHNNKKNLNYISKMNNILLFNGGGLNFFWYLGFINNINPEYLENYKFYGYSGGIVAFLLYLCDIKLEQIFDKF